MKRGRPVFSQVRLNMVDLLAVMGSSYGYELAKVYLDIFPKVSKRLFYYHLRKGVELGQFQIDKIEKETGEYSWGTIAEKIYYTLAENAQPSKNPQIDAYFLKRKNGV